MAMRAMRTTTYADDHFEPDSSADPQAQRRVRGHMEQVDYMAYACNREVLGALGQAKAEAVQRLALATAKARARWVVKALEISAAGSPSTEQACELTALRTAYEELGEAYEGIRRMIERGYVTYVPAAS
jgi:hypothetical protein